MDKVSRFRDTEERENVRESQERESEREYDQGKYILIKECKDRNNLEVYDWCLTELVVNGTICLHL